MATIILHDPWVRGDKLRAEGDKLQAAEEKLWGAGWKLWDEGEKLYQASIRDFFGESLDVDWWTGEVETISKEREVLPLGELFGYNNLT